MVLDASRERVRRAWMSVGGFASCQGFVLASLYLDAPGSLALGSMLIPCVGMISICVCAVIAFILIRAVSQEHRSRFFASPWLMVLACAPALGCIVRMFTGIGLADSLVKGVSVGFCAAVLLCAWGELLGREPIERSVPQVFIGSALGAAVGFVFGVAPLNGVALLVMLLPLVSAVLHRRLSESCAESAQGVEGAKASSQKGDAAPSEKACSTKEAALNARAEALARSELASQSGMRKQASELSARILAGTCVFGAAAGLVESFASSDATAASPPAAFVLLLFTLYCLAALQLFGGKPLLNVRAVLPLRDNDTRPEEGGPLDGSYRLAILLMMTGFLLQPALGDYALWAEHVTLAGYLGISTVMVSLFLIMGRLGGRASTLAFALGFALLFAGQAAGLMVGGMVTAYLSQAAHMVMLAVAGMAVIYGYLFLFTERDLRALSIVVESVDRFEEACAYIARAAKLSKRESEILPLALRGRTSERMASELFITKNTVDTHLRRIYAKCDVHNRQELIDLGERTEEELRRGVRLSSRLEDAR